ncbi:MAG: phytoene desaturase family protein [Planctomycetota bacterium]
MPPRDHLQGIQSSYDVIVVGSGLGGMTAANQLAKMGHKVLLLEHHYQLGGLASFFKRRGKRVFDISLHGFPHGMKKSCLRYWSKEIADDIVQVKGIRFENPQYRLKTDFDRKDFTRLLVEHFKIQKQTVDSFYEELAGMNFSDDNPMTTAELFEKYFPGRNDVVRFLMEPITYANGSTPDDPAISYGIVFNNFMRKGCWIYQGGTDKLVRLMREEMERNGVDVRIMADVKQVIVEGGEVRGVVVNDKEVRARCVVSNANLLQTIHQLVGDEHFSADFMRQVEAVRLNNSSTQVYIGLADGVTIPDIGDLLFTSSHPTYCPEALLAQPATSRTFSVYYPSIRPGITPERTALVSSTNAWWEDWVFEDDAAYEQQKDALIKDTIDCLEENYLPGIRDKIEWTEASTPRTFKRYTRHWGGASFGTKFEGLPVSMNLQEQIPGLFHAGSVGIIMSGWLGTMNYGRIQSDKVHHYLTAGSGAAVAR